MKSQKGKRSILFFFVLILLVASFSSGAASIYKKTNDYVIYDSEIKTRKDAQPYWLNNDTVLFIARPKGFIPPYNQKPKPKSWLYIWKLGAQPNKYKQAAGVYPHYLCYTKGTLYLATNTYFTSLTGREKITEYLLGPLGKETKHTRSSTELDKGIRFSALRCEYIQYPDHEKGKYQWTALKKEHGWLRQGPDSGNPKDPTTQTFLFPPGNKDGIKLPIDVVLDIVDIQYIAFKNVYQLKKRTRFKPRDKWEASNCEKLFYIYPDGKTETECVPYFQLTPKGDRMPYFYPTKKYLILSGGSERRLNFGFHLTKFGNMFQMTLGRRSRASISPDGCKIAAAQEVHQGRWSPRKTKQATTIIIDLCPAKTEGR